MRNLALNITDAGEPGEFLWAILESKGDAYAFPIEVAVADKPAATYMDALRAGYDKLATMAQEDPENGPQSAEPEAIDQVMQMRETEYAGHFIQMQCSQTTAGGWVPQVRVMRIGEPDARWRSSMVPFPWGGFLDLEEAFGEALATGKLAADGFFEDTWEELEEGGVETGPRLRDLVLTISESAMLNFSWLIEERAAEPGGQALAVALSRKNKASFQEALSDAGYALLALGADSHLGPRPGDQARPGLCPGAIFFPSGEVR